MSTYCWLAITQRKEGCGFCSVWVGWQHAPHHEPQRKQLSLNNLKIITCGAAFKALLWTSASRLTSFQQQNKKRGEPLSAVLVWSTCWENAAWQLSGPAVPRHDSNKLFHFSSLCLLIRLIVIVESSSASPALYFSSQVTQQFDLRWEKPVEVLTDITTAVFSTVDVKKQQHRRDKFKAV